MLNFKKFILAVSIASLSISAVYAKSPLPTAGDTLVRYGEVEGWTVYHNQSRGDCLIVSDFGMGSIQMGVTAENKDVGYLGVFTKLKLNKEGNGPAEIFISLGGNLYEGVSSGTTGNYKDGYSGGYILTDNPEFKRDIAKKYKMIVFPDTPAVFTVDLKGTYKAMKMARKCAKG